MERLWVLLAIILLAIGLQSCGTELSERQSNTELLRFMSVTLQDVQPTYEELTNFRDGSTNMNDLIADWLTTDEHYDRIRRFCREYFAGGVTEEIFLFDSNYLLLRKSNGAYYLNDRGQCADGSEITVTNAWFSDTPVSVCPDVVSGMMSGGGDFCADTSNLVANADCGCGPNLELCMEGENFFGRLYNKIREEIPDRCLEAYQNGGTWRDFFAGDYVVANRHVYWYYLYTSKILSTGAALSAAEVATLQGLPTDVSVRADFPNFAGAPERAGILTAPGFMQHNNNFRSRIRAISLAMSCTDISSGLNTSGISTFVNPDLGTENVSHGSIENCSDCHYPMDNMGSTILDWNTQGVHMSWQNSSTVGHAFGVDLTGPLDLMNTWVDQGPGFEACLARSTWQGFSNEDWFTLPAETQQNFIDLATADQTLRSLIHAILLSPEMLGLRGEETGSFTSGN